MRVEKLALRRIASILKQWFQYSAEIKAI
jgi:hypothetical protein